MIRGDDLLDQLPHRAPFRFLSEITAIDPGVCATGRWVINGDEGFLAGHFPREPIVPGVLLVEAMAQLAGLVGFAQGEDRYRSARLAHVDVKFQGAVVPPAVILLQARLVRAMGSLMLFDVSAQSNELIVASGRLALAASSVHHNGAVT